MHTDNKRGVAVTEIVLVVLGVVGLLAVVWLAWLRPSQASINTFDQCAQAGNPIQQSYPEVCVSADGKRFTRPTE